MHNNIRSSNLLLNDNDYLKIIDFNNTFTTKSVFDNYQPSYAKIFNNEIAENYKIFEYYSFRIEQFAINSILYYIIRDYKSYDNE